LVFLSGPKSSSELKQKAGSGSMKKCSASKKPKEIGHRLARWSGCGKEGNRPLPVFPENGGKNGRDLRK
jgi:hypothetical protein